jgi:hypothetical protein
VIVVDINSLSFISLISFGIILFRTYRLSMLALGST